MQGGRESLVDAPEEDLGSLGCHWFQMKAEARSGLATAADPPAHTSLSQRHRHFKGATECRRRCRCTNQGPNVSEHWLDRV